MKNYKTILRRPLSSGKIDKYQYLLGKETLHFNRSQIIGQPKLTNSPLGKSLETKTIEDVAKKQTKTIADRAEKQNLNTNQRLIFNMRFIFKIFSSRKSYG